MNSGKRYYSYKEFVEYASTTRGYLDKLLTNKKLISKNAKIDIKNSINKDWLIARGVIKVQTDEKDGAPISKTTLEIKLLQEKIKETAKRNILSDVKIKKEQNELISKDVMTTCIYKIFDVYFKNLLEYPHNVADEIISIIKSAKAENQRSELVDFMTRDIREQLDAGILKAQKELEKFDE